jgi:Na+-translocating ferredoxin:NAD+ oxidoreductase subunit B
MQIILFSVIAMGALGIISAVILFLVAQKFKIYEDPRIDLVTDALPGANCGGCGYAGCRNFADACIKAENLEKLFCPVGGNDCSKKVANILGLKASEKAAKVAVIRCAGSPEHRQKTNKYVGSANCATASALYAGETDCHYGCHGFGDCVVVCKFDAIYIDNKTMLPVVKDENCTACGACVTACPKNIIELRNKFPKDRKIFVSCVNKEKGGIAKKACTVACTGCTACVKECKFDAIKVENFLAYIDFGKCTLCRKCVEVCPTKAISEVNFPPKKEKKELPEKQELITKDSLENKELEKNEIKNQEENNDKKFEN